MEHIFTRLEEGLTYSKYMDLYTYSSPICNAPAVRLIFVPVSFTTFARIIRWLAMLTFQLVGLALIEPKEVDTLSSFHCGYSLFTTWAETFPRVDDR